MSYDMSYDADCIWWYVMWDIWWPMMTDMWWLLMRDMSCDNMWWQICDDMIRYDMICGYRHVIWWHAMW